MPYKIVKRRGARPWKIVRADTGKAVGSSTSRAKAARSIGYREAAEARPRRKRKSGRKR